MKLHSHSSPLNSHKYPDTLNLNATLFLLSETRRKKDSEFPWPNFRSQCAHWSGTMWLSLIPWSTVLPLKVHFYRLWKMRWFEFERHVNLVLKLTQRLSLRRSLYVKYIGYEILGISAKITLARYGQLGKYFWRRRLFKFIRCEKRGLVVAMICLGLEWLSNRKG